MLLGSGRVGSDDLGYGPGSGFSFEPVQTSSPSTLLERRREGKDVVEKSVQAIGITTPWRGL